MRHAGRILPQPRTPAGSTLPCDPASREEPPPLNLQQRSTLAGEAAAAAAEVETALATPADPTAAAFFDVDNTVMQGASIFHLARGLHRRKFFTTREIASAPPGSRPTSGSSASRTPSTSPTPALGALSFIAGHTVAELEELGEEIFDEAMAHRIWPGTRALAQMHLDEGQRVWLVTAAPIEIAQIIARRLGLTGAMGTVAEHVDGVYTGRLVGDLLHGPAKGEAVKALAAREGLDLAACSAYSDSYNDLPMLSLVGDPCAINPDARLRAHAREQGWRIRDYRTGRKAARAGARRRRGRGSGDRRGRRRGRAARRVDRRLTRVAGLSVTAGSPVASNSHLTMRRLREQAGAREGSTAMTWDGHDIGARARRPARRRRRALLDPRPRPAGPRCPSWHRAARREATGRRRDRRPVAAAGTTTPTWPPPRRTPRPSAPG